MKRIPIVLAILTMVIFSCAETTPTPVEEVCTITECANQGVLVDCGCECKEGYSGELCNRLNSSYVQTYLNDGISPFTLINSGMPIDSIYGKSYENGIIFHLMISNKIVKVVTKKDVEKVLKWTAAVNYCDGLVINGTDDWYLPNLEEVIEIRENLYFKLKKGDFENDYYWSSTTSDVDPNDAIGVFFLNGNTGPIEKDRQNTVSDNNVRAVRQIQL